MNYFNEAISSGERGLSQAAIKVGCDKNYLLYGGENVEVRTPSQSGDSVQSGILPLSDYAMVTALRCAIPDQQMIFNTAKFLFDLENWSSALLFLILGFFASPLAVASTIFVDKGPALFSSSGDILGQSEVLISQNHDFYLTTQTDGNLCVVREANGAAVWCSRNTSLPTENFVTAMQADGNLCTYVPGGTNAWCLSDTARYDGPFVLNLGNDANLCVNRVSAPAGESARVWCSDAFAELQTHGKPVRYGDTYSLQNGYWNWGGGYLDTRNAGCENNLLCVSTAASEDRDQGSGSWTINSYDGKPNGSEVKPGDRVLLVNRHPYMVNVYDDEPVKHTFYGGYLNLAGFGCEGNSMCVSTTASMWDVYPNFPVWTVEAPRNYIYEGQEVRLRNDYNPWGRDDMYLDTRESGCDGNLLCVSMSAGRDRDSGSGLWRFKKAGKGLVERFAPRLRFDGAAKGYPMSAQTFYEHAKVPENPRDGGIENTDANTLGTGEIPTYYQMARFGKQIRIKYWWFYGYQQACDGVSGKHNGDWETITVTLAESRESIAAVTFEMHGYTYTRLVDRDGVKIEDGTHPVVYVAKYSHASIYANGGTSNTCLPFEEFRNNSTGQHMDSWKNLVSLDDNNSEPWMRLDREGNFSWGYNGVNRHPTQEPPTATINAANWSVIVDTRKYSQCKKGDSDTGSECLQQCRSGYSDGGLICTNWSWNSLHSYTRNRYSYNYTIPTTDLGLLISDF